ncbi:MAG: hypothetical protein IKW20_00070 [Bacteroidales bacterium]|nr:hypothetical protein [Bacteroidales bacterium]
MELIFDNKATEFSADTHFNLHLEGAGRVSLYRRTSGTEWDFVADVDGDVIDVDVVCNIAKEVRMVVKNEPTMAEVTFGVVIEEKYEDFTIVGTDLILVSEAKKDSISSIKVNGGATLSGTPSPTSPATIISNQGRLECYDEELPKGYARLTGMVFNNGCYFKIDGFRLKSTDTLRISFTPTKACNLIGCYTTVDADNNYSIFLSTTSGSKYLRFGNGTYLSHVVGGQRYDVVVTPTGATGFASASTWSKKTFTCSVDMLVGTTSETATSDKFIGTIHGNIVVDGRLNLIPCRRTSDGVYGYYDTVSKTFYEPTVGECTGEDYDKTHIVVLEADGEDNISVRSINLNEGELEHIGYTSTGGTSNSTTFCGSLHKIRVRGGQKYTVSFGNLPSGANGVFINTWKTDGSWNARQAISSSGVLTYTIPDDIGWVNFTLYKTGGITIGADTWMQVELGASASDYEDYAFYGSANAEMFLSVGNYTDEMDVVSGEVTRKVGIKVLDGMESWSKGSNKSADGNSVFYFAINERANNDTSLKLMSSHYAFSGTISYSTLKKGCMSITQTTKNVYFEGGSIADLSAWKEYLAEQYASGTPVIVIYPLATEVVENVDPHTLPNPKGDFAILRTASVADLGMEVTYKKKAAEGPKLITFTVEGYDQPFTAEEGMNWIQFCASEYNVDEWTCSQDIDNVAVSYNFVVEFLSDDGQLPYGSDLVKANHHYTIYEDNGIGGGW